MNEHKRKKICIVVLGDVGRSPRMQYHGLSFLEEGYDVEFVGFTGSDPIDRLRSAQNVKFRYIYNSPEFKNYLPTVLAYVLKVLWQTLVLFLGLVMSNFPDYVLVQNPPAVPALGVCYIFCKLFRSKLCIDWHNYAYSILGLSVGVNHPLVKISKRFEFFFGRKADFNICVTKAMKEDLKQNYNIKAVTFYDRPPDFFKKPSLEDRHKLFLALGGKYDLFVKECVEGETIFTKCTADSKIILKENRPGLIITSTSWTIDENLNILLEALKEYDSVKEFSDLPNLICAITGKGPLKEFYIKIIEKWDWKHIQFITPWLKNEDYPVFLGSADLGVCLHESSSGLDLPMKVVDMFGCLVPVCAVNFNCISELVQHEKNGFIFKEEHELFLQIKKWFTGFPKSELNLHQNLKENLEKFQSLRWHDNWKFNVQPLF